MVIEQYYNSDCGYKPILIREGFQVGHLNFMPELRPEAIDRVERHNQTDEVFFLVKGGALLIAAVETPAGWNWETVRMRPGITYNIPVARWHTIAMMPEDLVMIVEKNNTHLHDVEYRKLTGPERRSLQGILSQS
jgi:mannose-6-phosphate isomerase-like protein (cupin superfamily)